MPPPGALVADAFPFGYRKGVSKAFNLSRLLGDGSGARMSFFGCCDALSRPA